MDRAVYFDELRKTSDVVKPIIARSLAALRAHNSTMYAALFGLLSRRTRDSSLLLKPLLVRLAYEVAGGRNWERISPICAAAEMINISSYQANLSFDGKFRALCAEDRAGQFIASMITRETVSDLVYDSSLGIDELKAKAVLGRLASSNKLIYVGQYHDLSVLTSRSLDRLADFDSYLSLYLERCHSLSGVFSGNCAAIGGILADAGPEQMAALETFGQSFGVGLHVVNDIGDFAPPEVIATSSLKQACDQFSDIRKGKLTLPIAYAVKYGNASQRDRVLELLGKSDASENALVTVTRTIFETGAFSYSKRLVKAHLRSAKLALRMFPESPARSMLSVMASQLRTNKYFAALRSYVRE